MALKRRAVRAVLRLGWCGVLWAVAAVAAVALALQVSFGVVAAL